MEKIYKTIFTDCNEIVGLVPETKRRKPRENQGKQSILGEYFKAEPFDAASYMTPIGLTTIFQKCIVF